MNLYVFLAFQFLVSVTFVFAGVNPGTGNVPALQGQSTVTVTVTEHHESPGLPLESDDVDDTYVDTSGGEIQQTLPPSDYWSAPGNSQFMRASQFTSSTSSSSYSPSGSPYNNAAPRKRDWLKKPFRIFSRSRREH